MTNKVKPFFIRITDDMTPRIIQDALDKCIATGATEKERADREWLEEMEYFGVCGHGGTYFSVDSGAYFDAQEITLDQLDEWLGLEVEVEPEWRNGDSCIFGSSDMSGIYITYDKYNSGHVIYSCGEYFYVLDGDFRKLETPEQKAERVKREEAEEMIQCLFDNYNECDDSAIEYVIDYLKECESLGR